jgi:hypothetical protein
MSLLAALAAAALAGPLPAPPVYVTPNYGLTFETPPGVTYCPLPENWTGSDHGTVLFLVPPERCDGARGYSEDGRDLSPDVPRIEIFYGYWDRDLPPPSCWASLGKARLMGKSRTLCLDEDVEGVKFPFRIWVRAEYEIDSQADVVITLVTSWDRQEADTKLLRQLAASVRPCSLTYRYQGKRQVRGTGAPCPSGKWF